MITLVVPPGVLGYPIAHGTTGYDPYPDGNGRWLVDVPADVALPLLHVGGFAVKKDPAPPDRGAAETAAALVALRHPEGAGCSFAGRSYRPDAAGVVRVPAAAVAELLAHGFVVAEEEGSRQKQRA
jgi:hypothetical protein